MGHRNPDRVSLSERRASCETVADMRQKGWDVITKCRVCGLVMRTDLDLIIKIGKGRASLWNRTHRCRREHCNGWVDFEGKPAGVYHFEQLRAPWPASRGTGVEDIGNDAETWAIAGKLFDLGCSRRDVRRILLDAQLVDDRGQRKALDDLDCRFRIGVVRKDGRRHVSGDDIGEWRGLILLRWRKD